MRSLFLVALLSAAAPCFGAEEDFSKAEKETENGRYAEAADEASRVFAAADKKAVVETPELMRALGRRAYYALTARRIAQVELDLVRLQQERPSAPAAGKLGLVEAARILSRLGRYEDALKAAHKALAMAPEDQENLGTIASVYSDLGRYDEAIQNFEAALKASGTGGNYWLRVELAKTYRLAGRFEEAAHLYAEARRDNADEAGAYYEEGYSRLFSGAKKPAANPFEENIAKNPMDPMAHHHYAASLFQLGDYAKSRKEFEEALRLHRVAGHKGGVPYAHTLMWLARLDGQDGREADRLRRTQEAVDAIAPYSSMWATLNVTLTDDLVNSGRAAKAEKRLSGMLKTCGESKSCTALTEAILHFGRARARGAKKDRPGAREDLAVVHEFVDRRIFGDFADCVTAMGLAAEVMGMYDRMGAWMEAERAGIAGVNASVCARDESAAVTLRIGLGQFYLRCGERDKANLHWRAALQSYEALRNDAGAAKMRALLEQPEAPPASASACRLSGAGASGR